MFYQNARAYITEPIDKVWSIKDEAESKGISTAN